MGCGKSTVGRKAARAVQYTFLDTDTLIEKESDGEETTTKVTMLTEEGSVGEVARLMGGSDVTETTLAAARELIAEK